MSKVYNTQESLASSLAKFFKKIFPSITKPQLKIIPYIILGMIESESVVTTDIIKKLKGKFNQVQTSSTVRRLERFFNSLNFNIYDLFQAVVSYMISKHEFTNKNIYIALDHTGCLDHFTILLFTVKIGKQGIPIWFRCFKGKNPPEALKHDVIKEGIVYTYNLLKDKAENIIFLGDRWFCQYKLMKLINEMEGYYCFRAKKDITIYVPNYGETVGRIGDIKPKEKEEQIYEDVWVMQHRYITNLVVSRKEGKDCWHILTNWKSEEAIESYNYRFGMIEFVFKNGKSNGFYLESTKMRNIRAFTTMFGVMCIALIWITILGVNYSNTEEKKRRIKIKDKRRMGRIFSYFNTGLMYFNILYNTKIEKISCSFVLSKC